MFISVAFTFTGESKYGSYLKHQVVERKGEDIEQYNKKNDQLHNEDICCYVICLANKVIMSTAIEIKYSPLLATTTFLGHQLPFLRLLLFP
jgi:hypothetical protein